MLQITTLEDEKRNKKTLLVLTVFCSQQNGRQVSKQLTFAKKSELAFYTFQFDSLTIVTHFCLPINENQTGSALFFKKSIAILTLVHRPRKTDSSEKLIYFDIMYHVTSALSLKMPFLFQRAFIVAFIPDRAIKYYIGQGTTVAQGFL